MLYRRTDTGKVKNDELICNIYLLLSQYSHAWYDSALKVINSQRLPKTVKISKMQREFFDFVFKYTGIFYPVNSDNF